MLSAVVDSIIRGTEYADPGKKNLEIGVDVLPAIPQDNTDRNRTSPLAFTGNKFEFRMLGSSQSIAGPNIALNTIMAEELEQFADELEGSKDFQGDLQKLIRRVFTEHQRIIFNGNGYDESWVEEAKKRGLYNLTSTADALPYYTAEKNVSLFTRHGIFTPEEMQARQDIHMENYCALLSIEGLTLLDMVRRDVLPAVSDYSAELCDRAAKKKGVSCRYETTLAADMAEKVDALLAAADQLEADLGRCGGELEEKMHYFHDTVAADMAKIRELADALETVTAKEYWPYPSYSDILFYM